MRCTKIMGLPKEAEIFLDENCEKVPADKCPHCGEVLSWIVKEEDYKDMSHIGMFDDGPILLKYYLKDGREMFEEVQCTPWSSGPCIFLCLKDQQGNILYQWSNEEIVNEI